MLRQILHQASWTADFSENSTVVTFRGGDVDEVEIVSLLGATPDAVWERISTMTGINDELWPFLRITHPSGVTRLAPGAVPIGRRAFRSWLLLFGVLPLDYDDLTFSEIVPGVVFEESAPTLSMRCWRHRRSVHGVPGGTRITDQIQFAPRLKVCAALVRTLLPLLFRWRHLRLRRAFRFPTKASVEDPQARAGLPLDLLNTPESRRHAIDAVAVRMRRVDEALGEDRLVEVSHLMSALVSFGNSDFGLGKHLRTIEVLHQEQVLTLLAQACSEIETGFNAVRLGNVSAAYRCGRVAAELIGLAVLVSVPRERIVEAINAEIDEGVQGPMLHVAKRAIGTLDADPDRTIFDCWLPPTVEGQVVGAPSLRAQDVVQLALCVARRVAGLDHELVAEMLEFRTESQHPASHGTAHVWAQGLDSTDGKAIGIFYDPARDERYRAATDDLICVMGAWLRVLTAIEGFVVPGGERRG